MKLTKKILICFTILIVLMTNLIFPFEKAKAASWADVTGYADEAFAAVMVGAMTVSAAGLHAGQFIDDNLNKIYDGAKEAYKTLAPEVKANFLESINSASDRILIADEWINHTLDNLYNSFKDLNTVNPSVSSLKYSVSGTMGDFVTMVKAPDGYMFESKNAKFSNDIININHFERNDGTASLSIDIYNYSTGYRNFDTVAQKDAVWSLLNKNGGSLSSVFAFASAVNSDIRLVASNGDYLDVYNNAFNDLSNRLRQTDLPSGQLDNIYFPRPEAYTPNNVKLRVNDTTGALTLPDGTIWTGDYTWRIPNTKVIEVDGVSIPTTTTAAGDIVDIRTGEVVIPAETDVPTKGELDTTPAKEKIEKGSRNWGALITTKFPFSLPWDFAYLVGLLQAEPMTPKWTVDTTNIADGKYPIKFDIDLSFLDPYIAWFRGFILVGFGFSLIFIHRSLVGGAK